MRTGFIGLVTFLTCLTSALLVDAPSTSSAPHRELLAFTTWIRPATSLDDAFQLCLVNDDGSHLEVVREARGGFEPCISPDGRSVVFVHTVLPPKVGARAGCDLRILSLIDRKVRTVYRHPEGLFSPVWSPDGQKIAFVRLRKTQDRTETRLGVVRTSGEPTPQDWGDDWVTAACWSPQWDRVATAVLRYTDRKFVIKLAGDGRVLHKCAGPVLSIAWSPDGKTLMYIEEKAETSFVHHTSVHALDVASGTDRLILDDGPTRIGLQYGRDGKTVYLTRVERSTILAGIGFAMEPDHSQAGLYAVSLLDNSERQVLQDGQFRMIGGGMNLVLLVLANLRQPPLQH